MFIGVFDGDFYTRKKGDEGVTLFSDGRAKRAGELSDRRFEKRAVAGVDDIENGFGLSEVKFAVEEGATGKLAGLSGSGAGVDYKREYFAGNEQSAVAIDFQDVVRGIRMGRGKESSGNLVESAEGIGVKDMAESDGSGRRRKWNIFIGWFKYFF